MENNTSAKFREQYIMMIEWLNNYINTLLDEEFRLEISPGKNHGVWILGHLISSDDDFSVYMGKGELLFPEYQKLFGQGSRLQPPESYPPVSELKNKWNMLFEKNKKIYSELKDHELDEIPENADENFTGYFKTKGIVVMAWNLHQMYHGGQLGVLAVKAGKKMF